MDTARRPAVPAVPACGCPPTAARYDLTRFGHRGRGNARIPDAHTGHRTPATPRRSHRTLDAGHLDAHTGHWTPVAWTSHAWILDADTGYWTLAEDADRATRARPAAGHRGPRRRAPPLGPPWSGDGACGAREPMTARR
jgi:hypothetical protein